MPLVQPVVLLTPFLQRLHFSLDYGRASTCTITVETLKPRECVNSNLLSGVNAGARSQASSGCDRQLGDGLVLYLQKRSKLANTLAHPPI
mmetsp:Transcript_35627/g.56980  ORF Transcript_35627/g.56980 Transcript_35627/m.56980 type:complete len:90 (-) Transcript_35627:358-627(-)